MTSGRQGIAYDPSGRILALVDANELLVHDGETGEPLWREAFEEELLGVAIAGDDLVVVGELGLLVHMSFLRRELSRLDLDATSVTFAVHADGRVAVAQERAVRIITRGRVQTLPRNDVGALAFSSDGRALLLAVGPKRSTLEWVDVATLASVGETSLALHVEAIAADESQFFVAQGEQLDSVTTHDAPVKSIVSGLGFTLKDVIFDKATHTLALQCGRSIIDLYDAKTCARTLRLQYPVRVVRGLAFGPKPWLGIALAGGDANRVHMGDRQVLRTPTHPGRAHQTWIVSVEDGSGTPRLEGDGPRGFKGQPPRPALNDDQAKALADAQLELQHARAYGFWGPHPLFRKLLVGACFGVAMIVLRECGLL